MEIKFSATEFADMIGQIRSFLNSIDSQSDSQHPTPFAELEDDPWDKYANDDLHFEDEPKTLGEILDTIPVVKQAANGSKHVLKSGNRRRTLYRDVPVATEEPVETPVRKGRKKAAVKPKKNSRTTKQPDIEISDQDMQNAASQGAKKILPAGVKKIMKEFGANKVVDIPQSARREFLDQLAAAG
jgi:hypothetical protein